MREIGLKQALDEGRRVLGLHVLLQGRADGSVSPEVPADGDVVSLHGVSVVADGDPRTEETDVADVVLGARVMAARQMDVDRLVETDRIAALRNRRRVSL